ncbi:unnamed protein product [Amoebophrya sp. A120]|nr:unnamed protein product [Amoebophrya sp. A120]|eukprot:GSA120T00001015001.1
MSRPQNVVPLCSKGAASSKILLAALLRVFLLFSGIGSSLVHVQELHGVSSIFAFGKRRAFLGGAVIPAVRQQLRNGSKDSSGRATSRAAGNSRKNSKESSTSRTSTRTSTAGAAKSLLPFASSSRGVAADRSSIGAIAAKITKNAATGASSTRSSKSKTVNIVPFGHRSRVLASSASGEPRYLPGSRLDDSFQDDSGESSSSPLSTGSTTTNDHPEDEDDTSWATVNRYWVFAGGGVRAVSYAGAFARMTAPGKSKWNWDTPLSSLVDGAMGTSAGSITAMLVVLGYTPKELLAFLTKIDWASFADGPTGEDFKHNPLQTLNRIRESFFERYGWNTGDPLREALTTAIKAKGFAEDVTFLELFEQKKKELFVVVFSVAESKSVIFSHETVPHMPIRDAVVTSSSMPFYFQARFFQKLPKTDACLKLLENRRWEQNKANKDKAKTQAVAVVGPHEDEQGQGVELASTSCTLQGHEHQQHVDLQQELEHQLHGPRRAAARILSTADEDPREYHYVGNVAPYTNPFLPAPENLPAFGKYADWTGQVHYAVEPFADGGTLDNFPLEWLMERKPVEQDNMVLGFLVLDSDEQVDWWYGGSAKAATNSNNPPPPLTNGHVGAANLFGYPGNYVTAELTNQQLRSMQGNPTYVERTLAINTLGVSAAQWDVMKDVKMVHALVLNGCKSMDKLKTPGVPAVDCADLVNKFLLASA